MTVPEPSGRKAKEMTIRIFSKRTMFCAASAIAAGALLAVPAVPAVAQGKQIRVTIGVTETVASHNPHGDSISMGYAIWCQVMGCLGTYDFEKGEYVGMLAERWEVDRNDPNVWTFHLKKGVKRHNDGRELTAEDFVHSFKRISTDPQSRQKQNIRPVKEMVAVDKYTLRVVTKQPTAPLLEYLFDRFMVTGKDLYEKHGARDADRKYPWGWGPYKMKELVVGQRIVLEKNKDHPDVKPENPDLLIYSVMREPEQRVTALLNGEIQIAQFIPPHLAPRIESASNAKLAPTNSVEIMFLAMSPKYKPWDNKLLRQAVCHAIDKDAITKAVLQGKARRLDGPIGEGQYGYDPAYAKKYLAIPYDPAKAKALVKQSGYKGEPVALETPVGRYINDKQITEAIIPMLREVGINVRLATPEWSTLWSNVQKGRTAFYYMGRGSVVDPSVALAQYFETGGSPRIGISDPAIDAALGKERVTFDPELRKEALNVAFKAIVDSGAACFMWRHNLLYGLARNVEHKPTPSMRIFGTAITVKN
jgi:peptide/nickel transport system substrate-binding protein